MSKKKPAKKVRRSFEQIEEEWLTIMLDKYSDIYKGSDISDYLPMILIPQTAMEDSSF
jgi:hypothetical protein